MRGHIISMMYLALSGLKDLSCDLISSATKVVEIIKMSLFVPSWEGRVSPIILCASIS